MAALKESFLLECAICLDREVDMEFQCNHGYCFQCAVKISTCPLCRTPVSRIYLVDESRVNAMTPIEFPENPLLFKSLSIVIKQNIADVSKLITQISYELKGFLSITQTETLLDIAKSRGILDSDIEKNLVKLCNVPWNVDVSLGGSGVCYHGNIGYSPDNYQHARQIILENVSCISDDMKQLEQS